MVGQRERLVTTRCRGDRTHLHEPARRAVVGPLDVPPGAGVAELGADLAQERLQASPPAVPGPFADRDPRQRVAVARVAAADQAVREAGDTVDQVVLEVGLQEGHTGPGRGDHPLHHHGAVTAVGRGRREYVTQRAGHRGLVAGVHVERGVEATGTGGGVAVLGRERRPHRDPGRGHRRGDRRREHVRVDGERGLVQHDTGRDRQPGGAGAVEQRRLRWDVRGAAPTEWHRAW